MPNLLDGIKVIDWTQAHHGAATAYMLADLGADVIKVEDPKGDLARTWRSIMGVDLDLPGGRNILFEGANRGKRSITLNLKTEEGRDIFRRLAGQADVLVTNHRPSVRERLGLDYPSLSQSNPRLIYAVASGYGEKGPFADERSFDNVAFAWSGMMHCIGEEDSPPLYMTPGAADQLGATMLAQGIMGALYWRERNRMGAAGGSLPAGRPGPPAGNALQHLLDERPPSPAAHPAAGFSTRWLGGIAAPTTVGSCSPLTGPRSAGTTSAGCWN